MIIELNKRDLSEIENNHQYFRIVNYNTRRLKNIPIFITYINNHDKDYRGVDLWEQGIIGYIKKYDPKKDKYIVDLKNAEYKDFSDFQLSLAICCKSQHVDRFNIDLNDNNWTIICGVLTKSSDISPMNTVLPLA